MSRTFRPPYIADGLNPWGKVLTQLKGHLLLSPIVDTGHWQAMKDVPNTMTRELQHVHIQVWPHDAPDWAAFMTDGGLLNQAWCDEHFGERISGVPSNPGEAYKRWPWYQGNVEEHKQPGQFSHTYQERIWSRFTTWKNESRSGIRYRFGDLNDLVNLLRREPYTRQAYLPIWFPEDLAAASDNEQRVPCTLGWHFMLRDDQLHVFYPMRSVDLYRYLTDDIYMAGLMQRWIIQQCCAGYSDGADAWAQVKPGRIELFASSLHIFDGDVRRAQRELEEVSASGLD